MIRRLLALAALAGLLVGIVVRLLVGVGAADTIWAASTALMLVPLTWSVARTLWRGDLGVDAIALVAMASALATGEYLAGSVVAVMLAGGNALEEYAAGRARRELTKLLERAPRVAHRRRGGAVNRNHFTGPNDDDVSRNKLIDRHHFDRAASSAMCDPRRAL